MFPLRTTFSQYGKVVDVHREDTDVVLPPVVVRSEKLTRVLLLLLNHCAIVLALLAPGDNVSRTIAATDTPDDALTALTTMLPSPLIGT